MQPIQWNKSLVMLNHIVRIHSLQISLGLRTWSEAIANLMRGATLLGAPAGGLMRLEVVEPWARDRLWDTWSYWVRTNG